VILSLRFLSFVERRCFFRVMLDHYSRDCAKESRISKAYNDLSFEIAQANNPPILGVPWTAKHEMIKFLTNLIRSSSCGIGCCLELRL
jgi:hypothetical protein